MRHLLLSVTAALALAGCAADRQDAEATSAAQRSTQIPQTPRPTALAAATRQAGFASMPDRGALLAYAPGREVIQRGAETYRAVELSEAHALHAAAPGRSIEVPTPSGETLRIGFQRVEESLDGNWSWIGRTADGQDAVITFGEKAVFGRIAQRGTEALRLTTSGGRTWLVQTDPSRVLDANNAPGGTSDMLVPPSTASAILARKAAAQLTTGNKISAQLGGVDIKASAAQTVDVVVGYTNGLASRLGGTSQAATRIANLIALTNQAYANSSITPRVRLVNTLQVTYTDTNTNDVALEELTGITCTTTSCSPQTVPAGLVPLRSARDQYGGDLVSLLRPLQQPQQAGCGISWLNGGGGTTIDTGDADFGYSVVSDGTDVDETDGRTYSCSDTSLAHEMGHNMGQQHNIEDSAEAGAHTYSYGYRETSTTGFYTIMAYRLPNSSQFEINYFGNPSVTYTDTGRATGTATANNAASLNITMPLVAQFRAAVVPFNDKVPNDINGNGTSDLVWYNQTTGQFAYWLMNGGTQVSSGIYTVPTQFRIAALADLDGDSRVDLIWRDTTGQGYYYWRSRGDGQFDTGLISSVPNAWVIKGIADLNGDGRDDIIWHNATDQLYATWQMNGPASIGTTRVYPVSNTYTLVGTGDINGDGRDDLVWSNPSIRQLYAWSNRGDGTWDYLAFGGYGTGWEVVDLADVDGDGRDDLIWENSSAGLFAHWLLNGTTVQNTAVVSIGPARVAVTGDFNGDGRADVMAQNPTSGVLTLYRSNASNGYDVVSAGGANTAWSIIR